MKDIEMLNAFTLKQNEDGTFTFAAGTIYPVNAFEADKTFIVDDNPNNIRKAFYGILGLPEPKCPTEKKQELINIAEGSIDPHKTFQEIELGAMTAKEIVDKVYRETGVRITLSLKSKQSIIRRAIECLWSGQPDSNR